MIDKQCRKCKEVKLIDQFYSEVRTRKNGAYFVFHKSKCIPCENEHRTEARKRRPYVKDNKPKKPVRLANDMNWAFSRVLEGVFYNRPNRKIKEETF
jgi:RNase P subunit RPR2